MKVLALTSAVLTGLLIVSIGWFALRSDPLGGEPYAMVSVDPSTRPTTGKHINIARNDGAVEAPATQRPPGTAPPSPPQGAAVPASAKPTPSPGTPSPSPSQGAAPLSPSPGAAPLSPSQRSAAPASAAPPASPGAVPSPGTAPPAPSSQAALAETEAVVAVGPDIALALPDVPDGSLVEKSRYGSLPKIAANGRMPSQRYARPSAAKAQPQQGEPARIAILINGMGLSEQITTQAIKNLPGQVTLAFSPYGRNLQSWVGRARADGHEVMLQVPLEPFDYPDNDPGPQTLLTGLTPEENLKRLLWLLGRFTGYTGITNHMGAKFAATQNAFLPILEEVRRRGLIYVDDGTSARSTAGQIARDLGLGFSVAQVQIDTGGTPASIEKALGKLETIALENGYAIGVGTSLPATIEHVSAWTRALERKGIILIPVSAAVSVRQQS